MRSGFTWYVVLCDVLLEVAFEIRAFIKRDIRSLVYMLKLGLVSLLR